MWGSVGGSEERWGVGKGKVKYGGGVRKCFGAWGKRCGGK